MTQRIGETFIWVLVPSQAADDPTISWEETRVNGPDPLAVRVAKKLRNEEALITEYSGARLRMDLDRVPLWRGDHVATEAAVERLQPVPVPAAAPRFSSAA